MNTHKREKTCTFLNDDDDAVRSPAHSTICVASSLSSPLQHHPL